MGSNGIIMFNKNEKCTVRALVSLYTIRQHYDGPITFFIETSPPGFDESVKHFGCDVVYNDDNKELKTLVRKTSLFVDSPYDRTLWLDSDTVLVGKVDEMFDYLENYDVAIPHFAGWHSDGRIIKRRVMNFKGHVSDEILNKAIGHKPAVNTGVVAYRKNCQFMKDWIDLAIKTNGLCFISDEIAFQVLYPSYQGIYVAPMKFNVSVRFGNEIEDKRIIHMHGQKHCIPLPLCEVWKSTFQTMRDTNIANINYFVDNHSDRRLRKFLKGEKVWGDPLEDKEYGINDNEDDEAEKEEVGYIANAKNKDTTIVTACDENYVEILRETFANWRKYKSIDDYPVMVFVHGVPIEDPRLDFLKLPNVKIVPWSMPNAESHREEMLSAYVFGTAENVKTDYWLKLDADSYATDDRPFIDDSMKEYDFCGHKWGYSRPDHIRKLDEWAKGHSKRKLKNAKPMIEEGKIQGNRFYHNVKRTISYIQLHKAKFTRFCVNLLNERKLPAPTQDTYMFFVANRFDPDHVGIKNFKKGYGFTQGKGKWGAEVMRQKLKEVDEAFSKRGNIVETVDQVDQVDSEDVAEDNGIEVEIVRTPKIPDNSNVSRSFIIPEGKDVIVQIVKVD